MAWSRSRFALDQRKPWSREINTAQICTSGRRAESISKQAFVASFFFHGRGAPIRESPLGLLRSLLHQILEQIPDLLSEFNSLFKKKRETLGEPREKWEWHVAELQNFLEASVPRVSEVFSIRIFVDALDECGEDVARDLVAYFQRLTSKSLDFKANFSICFSCRQYPVLTPEHGLTIGVEDSDSTDIETYVQGELERETLDKSKVQELTQKIIEKASGIFQWVVLVIPTVLKLHREGYIMKAVQKRLQKIAKELHTLYQDILEGIDDEDQAQSLQLMQWICFTNRPLLLEELRFAMVVDDNTPHKSLTECQKSEAYAETTKDMEKRVKSLSGGLAEVKEHQSQRVAQSIHQSVNDYLVQSGLQRLDSPSTNSVIGRAHFRLSRSCIRYLTMEEVLYCWRSGEKQELERGFPFLRYATTNWIAHVEIVEAERISQKDLPDLFQWPSHQVLQSWTHIYKLIDPYSVRIPVPKTTLLHITSRYGLLTATIAVIDLENNVKADAKDDDGRTPLSWAAECGQEAVVKLLIGRDDVEADVKDGGVRTPLSYAACYGNKAVVKLLADRDDVKADAKDQWGWTPLFHAVIGGQEAMVKLLADQDNVEADAKDKWGQTPLLYAAVAGQKVMFKLLADWNDIKVDARDQRGRTSLFHAAIDRQEAIVKLLIDRDDVKTNARDEWGRTPLFYAAMNGQGAIIKLLTDRDDVEINARDQWGRTPLFYAAGIDG